MIPSFDTYGRRYGEYDSRVGVVVESSEWRRSGVGKGASERCALIDGIKWIDIVVRVAAKYWIDFKESSEASYVLASAYSIIARRRAVVSNGR
jgi:hypothetical protein